MANGRGDYSKRSDTRRLVTAGGEGGAKFFARPIVSEADDTATDHAEGAAGWFKKIHPPWHGSYGTEKGSRFQAYCLTECPGTGVLSYDGDCLVETIDGRKCAVSRECPAEETP